MQLIMIIVHTWHESRLTRISLQVWGKFPKHILLGVQLRIWLIAEALKGDALAHRNALWRNDGVHLIMRSIGGAQHLRMQHRSVCMGHTAASSQDLHPAVPRTVVHGRSKMSRAESE